ncbi:Cof-type HAD-IIB family hydrolase [Pediococcus claussenii]|uniref:Hydrolase, haloacid dehalogenase-like protein n=1 Tax=Pediococcus claussenii (strain ATCC BAA-344 / DSM 14800 / JCM 18046 / KCTC 3811 / LMG 21948 / P06) TaxID=701521 RepID=G8PC44_PEDCP|nr:Cof-type HAD-IIB family hydrolase [Pediococcus claussenii]AEV94863.1 hydrolase, haloacid dehalogenase-like protein [Pediococcus claussenii ATCC BAA-344]ANZ70059.1 HAD family hydrolase [Pediococcus claussenii]ANZ71874.1 HAD family hydrolase [Pediococcus claussenii]
MISIIASDMDGTLLNEQMQISPENAAAIKQAQNAGVHFVVATGREYKEAHPLVETYGIEVPMITLNGAAIFDVDGKPLDMVPITRTSTRLMMHKLNRAGLYFEITTNEGVISNSRTRRIETLSQLLEHLNPETPYKLAVAMASARVELVNIRYVDDYQEVLDDNRLKILKIVAFANGGQKELQPIKEAIESEIDITISSSFENNIEINSPRAQKGIALQHYADELNIPMSQVMAIGDNLNDASMLKIAGISYAMGNATPEIKQITNHLTVTNNENGVAKAILEQLAQNKQ